MNEELHLLSAIDFLPHRYRDARLKRSAGVWRILVVIVLCGMLISAAVFQQQLLWQAEADLARIEPLHAAAQKLAKSMAEEQAGLPESDKEASLFTYLRHPWPRTGLINAVLKPVPASMQLTNLSLGFEMPERPAGESVETKSEDPVDKTPSPARNLKRLRNELDGGRWVITLNGLTSELAELHVYVADLEREKRFAKVDLVSIDTPHSANAAESRFVIRILIRPGYGQPDGPAIETTTAAEQSMAGGAG